MELIISTCFFALLDNFWYLSGSYMLSASQSAWAQQPQQLAAAVASDSNNVSVP